MRTVILLVLVIHAFAASGSTVDVRIETHMAASGSLAAPKIIRATFTDEPLIAEVRLRIFAVPQLPSTREHLDTLRALPGDAWFERLEWSLIDVRSDRPVEGGSWRLLQKTAEERGPSTGDPTKAVDVRTLTARFAFDRALPPGDYGIGVRIGGIASHAFPFAVRTGEEAEVRDAWLAREASRAEDFGRYRAMQSQRVERDPRNWVAWLELAHRSLEEGTLEETQRYYDRAARAMELLVTENEAAYPEWARRERAEAALRTARIQGLQEALPEYFAHRSEWRIAIDAATGNYVIRSRREGRLIRTIDPDVPKSK